MRSRSGGLIDRFDDHSTLWACYEAGPTGYELYRLLMPRWGVRCDVVAPSLIPKRRCDVVAPSLIPKRARRSGEDRQAWTRAIWPVCIVRVNSPRSGSQRRRKKRCEICVAPRGDMVEDLTRARNRLTKFLLRHSLVWRGGSNWTFKHERWLAGLHFDDRALAATFAHYRATVARYVTPASPRSQRTSRHISTRCRSVNRPITSPRIGASRAWAGCAWPV